MCLEFPIIHIYIIVFYCVFNVAISYDILIKYCIYYTILYCNCYIKNMHTYKYIL
jgi:hypothetical protein